jgi:hypothetical protein
MDSRGADGAPGDPDASSSADPPGPEPDPAAAADAMYARLPADLLRSVLQRLPPIDLARSACVCRAWHAVASDRSVLEAAFCAPWGVRRVVGEPATQAFWRASSLGRFALSHAVRRGDTVPGVALKYSVQVRTCSLNRPPALSLPKDVVINHIYLLRWYRTCRISYHPHRNTILIARKYHFN